MRVWCTPGGGGQHVLTGTQLLYAGRAAGFCLIEEKQTTSIYLSSYSTLLGYRPDKHTCMRLSIRLEVLTPKTLVLFILSLNRMFHVQCVTLQHEKQLWWFLHDLPALHLRPGYLWQAAVADLGGVRCQWLNPSLVPRPSMAPVFDRLQYAKTDWKAWERG